VSALGNQDQTSLNIRGRHRSALGGHSQAPSGSVSGSMKNPVSGSRDSICRCVGIQLSKITFDIIRGANARTSQGAVVDAISIGATPLERMLFRSTASNTSTACRARIRRLSPFAFSSAKIASVAWSRTIPVVPTPTSCTQPRKALPLQANGLAIWGTLAPTILPGRAAVCGAFSELRMSFAPFSYFKMAATASSSQLSRAPFRAKHV
jgi:hypothetical protein